MKRTHLILFTALAVIGSVILLAVSYLLAETAGLIIAAAAVFLLFLAFSTFRTNYLILNEMEVGVLFDRHDNFICFVDNVYGRIFPRAPGTPPFDDDSMPPKLSKPITRHRINPATEVLKSKLRKGSFDASGVSKDVRTKEGIQVTIPWSVSFRIEVLRILPGVEYKMARALPENAPKMVAGRMMQIIQHVVGQMDIAELYATPGNSSAIQKLEDEVRRELLTRAKAIGICGVAGNDLKIGPIELPRQIETEMRVAYQRQLHTEAVAKSLNILREAVTAFTAEDMTRLTDLERLRILDEKAKSLIMTEPYLMVSKEGRPHSEDELFPAYRNGHN